MAFLMRRSDKIAHSQLKLGGRNFSFFMGEPVSQTTITEQRENELSSLLESSPESVTTEDFLVVLRVLADSKQPDAALRAERWLRRLEQIDHCSITSECCQRVIEAWAGAVSEDPARVIIRAEGWLRKYRESTIQQVQPDTACFNAFLDVCTRGRPFKGSHTGHHLVREHAEMSEKVLRFMIAQRQKMGPKSRVAPDTESFNLVIRGWTRCRKDVDLADRAMGVHQLMETYSTIDPSVEPDARTYGLIMDSIGVRAKLKAKQCRREHERNNPMKNGLEEINLLRSILEIVHAKKSSGDERISPDTYGYNILLGCWASIASLHENATAEVESIIRHMTSLTENGYEGVSPDNISYLMVMRAWANSKKANRGERVMWLLSKQWKDYEFSGDEKIRPTVENYNISIRTWSDLHNPREAEYVLRMLVKQAESLKIQSLQPNTESYAILIKAWLKLAGQGSDVALKAGADWMNELQKREEEETGILSSVELYLAFFGAAKGCAKSSPELTLRLTFEQFDQLKSSRHMMDPLHYSRLVQIVILALPKPEDMPARQMALSNIIVDCKDAGLVSSSLLQSIVNSPTKKEGWTVEESRFFIEEFFPQFPLPTSWTRNIRDANLVPKRNHLVRKMPTAKRFQNGAREQQSPSDLLSSPS